MSSRPDTASSIDLNGGAPAVSSEPRPMYWSVRRELWENRSVYVAPLVVTAFVLFASLISIAVLPHRMRSLPTPDLAALVSMALKPFRLAPAPIMLVSFVVGFFYSIDALYGERRDRSILFWKSLPVSDRTTVLSKAGIPLVVLPLFALVLSIITQVIMLIVSTPVLAGTTVGPGRVWTELQFFPGVLIMFYGLAVHTLWFAPIYCGLLFVSAWARRAPVLWAVLPLVVISAFERLAFNTSYFTNMLQYRVTGAMKEAFTWRPGAVGNADRLWQLEPGRFLGSPGLWVGLLFAVACLAATVRLRRNREPI